MSLLSRTNGFDQRLDALQVAQYAPHAWMTRIMKKKAIFHLSTGQSIEGVLMEQTQDGVILRAADLLLDDGKRTKMAGEVLIPEKQIVFAQLDE